MPIRKPNRWLADNKPDTKGLYDKRCKGAALDIGDLVLVKQTAWKGRHKIQDRWESDEYQVIGQPNPGSPVYEVKSVAGAGLGFCIEIYCCPCKGESGNKVGRRWNTPKALRRRRRKKRVGYLVCLRHTR